MEDRIEKILSELTLEEKVGLAAGSDMWHAAGVERLGIPPLEVSDGPNGARGAGLPGAGLPTACFPCGSALGATWSAALVERVGAALGEEARDKGAHVLLAPTVNIQRAPLAGRNFECFSEDPWLSARLAAAYVRGVQSTGVGACVKHFVCNDSEHERHTVSSEVGERALREVYLRPFEAAVCEAGAWALMGAYNRLCGVHCCEHPRLLGEILKREWGFDGVVISDWYATQSGAAAANAGLDLEMPGPPRHFGRTLLDAVREGAVGKVRIDDMARRLLRLRLRTGALGSAPRHALRTVDRPEQRSLAREAAREAIVLLRNEGGTLPLDAGRLDRLAVIGPAADAPAIQGGGSAQVTPHHTVTPLDGIRRRCEGGARVVFEPGCSRHRKMPILDHRHLVARSGMGEGRLLVEFFAGAEPAGERLHAVSPRRASFTWFGAPAPGVPEGDFAVRCTATFVPAESGAHTMSLCAVGRARLFVDGALVVDNWSRPSPGEAFFGAGSAEVRGRVSLEAERPYELVIEYACRPGVPISGFETGCLAPQPADLMERAVDCAALADAAVVVVGLDAEWETEGRDREDLELPGRQAELVERVAVANPRTVVVLNAGSPVRMEWLERVPAVLQLWYPGQECGNALADVVFGDADPSGRLPITFPRQREDDPTREPPAAGDGRSVYGEGVFVGHRSYDARGIVPLFPFGFGLSYTSFEYANLSVAEEVDAGDDPIPVSVDVTNTGSRTGSEVVQIYLHDAKSRVERPLQELAAAAKIEIDPGETRTVELEIERRALCFYDPDLATWVAEPGEFELRIGRSSRDIRARGTFRLLPAP